MEQKVKHQVVRDDDVRDGHMVLAVSSVEVVEQELAGEVVVEHRMPKAEAVYHMVMHCSPVAVVADTWEIAGNVLQLGETDVLKGVRQKMMTIAAGQSATVNDEEQADHDPLDVSVMRVEAHAAADLVDKLEVQAVAAAVGMEAAVDKGMALEPARAL